MSMKIAIYELVFEDVPAIAKAVAEPLKVAGSIGIIFTVIGYWNNLAIQRQDRKDREANEIVKAREVLAVQNSKVAALEYLLTQQQSLDGIDMTGVDLFFFHDFLFNGSAKCWTMNGSQIEIGSFTGSVNMAHIIAPDTIITFDRPKSLRIFGSDMERGLIELPDTLTSISITYSNLKDARIEIVGSRQQRISWDQSKIDGAQFLFDDAKVMNHHIAEMKIKACVSSKPADKSEWPQAILNGNRTKSQPLEINTFCSFVGTSFQPYIKSTCKNR